MVLKIQLPDRPDSEDLNEIKKWRWSTRKAKKANSEMHSLRCDIELKLSVCYPVPSVLVYISSVATYS